MQKQIEELDQLKAEASAGGGIKKLDAQHSKGKLGARERIHFLLDPGSFEELGQLVTHRSHNFGLDKTKFFGDGVVTGYGTIKGRLVYVFAQDFTVMGGSLAEAHSEKITKLQDLALENGAPIIGLNDSGGARIQEGVVSLAAYADIFYRNSKSSGVIPQISAIMGPCAGGAVYSPALTDFIFMVENSSYMFVTGPNVVKTVTQEEVSADELGGAATHSEKSGVCHKAFPNEITLLQGIRKLMDYIPQNCEEKAPSQDVSFADELRPKLRDVMPASSHVPYEMHEVIEEIIDKDSFFEIQPDFAKNIITGFAHLGGKSVGVVANQPAVLAGVLDIEASTKAARFVRFCDAFNIPLLVLEDVPGFLPGTKQEWNAIITNGAKLLYAFSEASVPRITVITRKAYGGAYDVMNSKHIGADINYAFPTAEIAVMGARGAAEIIFKKEIKEANDPAEALRLKETEYSDMFAHPYRAAARGYVDEVIDPAETRVKLIRAFDMLKNKAKKWPAKKHSNMPL